MSNSDGRVQRSVHKVKEDEMIGQEDTQDRREDMNYEGNIYE